MRELSDIKQDIEEVSAKIRFYEAQRNNLIKERGERRFADFYKEHRIKKGDIQIVGYDTRYDWIVCRKIKKNGEPYASTTTLSPSGFSGCVILTPAP